MYLDNGYTMVRVIAKFWCRSCNQSTRLLRDGRRCPECHPLAGCDEWRPPPWCGQCDQRTRQAQTVAGISRCPQCHPMARPPMRWPVALVPETWTDQLTACEWLCYISPTLRKLGVDGLRKTLRKYFESRWTPNDVLYALDRNSMGELYIDNTPTGNESAQVVGRWLDRRLRQWEDGDGVPLTPLGDHIAVLREQKIATQNVNRIKWEERAAAAADAATHPGAATARQIARDAALRARRVHASASTRELAARRAELNAEDHRRDTLLALEKHIATAA